MRAPVSFTQRLFIKPQSPLFQEEQAFYSSSATSHLRTATPNPHHTTSPSSYPHHHVYEHQHRCSVQHSTVGGRRTSLLFDCGADHFRSLNVLRIRQTASAYNCRRTATFQRARVYGFPMGIRRRLRAYQRRSDTTGAFPSMDTAGDDEQVRLLRGIDGRCRALLG